MRFRGFRVARGPKDDKYHMRRQQDDISVALKDLFAGLVRLNFEDNFQSFAEDVIIKSGEEVSITNRLQGGAAKLRIIARQQGNGLLTDGAAWTNEKMTIKNHGPDDVTATIIFMR